MKVLRYLSFEINKGCPNSVEHSAKCPSGHPDRYKFGITARVICDEIILKFWRFCRSKGFGGLILWHMYNEPALEIVRIRRLMHAMRRENINQGFQITTSINGNYDDFDIVKISDYSSGITHMDNRIAAAFGPGRPYSEMPPRGLCGRGSGWEIPIDHYGNWCLCCGDWMCEETIGNIHNIEKWDELYLKWTNKRKTIRWFDESSYNRLPRLCRACLQKNPALSVKGGI